MLVVQILKFHSKNFLFCHLTVGKRKGLTLAIQTGGKKKIIIPLPKKPFKINAITMRMRYFHTLNFTYPTSGHRFALFGSIRNPILHYYSMNSFYFFTVTDVEQDFKEARERGLPQPILYVAEYLSVDSEGLRWHRAFRNAGHFAYILLWSVFHFYLLCLPSTCLLVIIVISYTSSVD